MKDLLDYLVGGIHLDPQPKVLSIVVCTAVNATVRFGALFGIVYVTVRAFRIAMGS